MLYNDLKFELHIVSCNLNANKVTDLEGRLRRMVNPHDARKLFYDLIFASFNAFTADMK